MIRRMNDKKRSKITISIENDLLVWLDNLVKVNHLYYNRSHTLEIALSNLKEKIEES